MNISNIINSISLETYNSIEIDRNNTMGDENFIQWCKQYNIGSRVEVKNWNADEIMNQYPSYASWIASRVPRM